MEWWWSEIVGRSQKELDIDIIINSMSLDIKGGGEGKTLATI
jgi:hypothetical protein